MTTRYKHTQIGYLTITFFSVALLLIGVMIVALEFDPVLVIALVVLLVVLALFATLTVTLDDHLLRIHFGMGLIHKRFPLKEIERYHIVKNPWYYGWGIRYTPRGWLFNVSGFSAIELQMKSGRRYRIGTDEPERLAQALADALDRPPPLA